MRHKGINHEKNKMKQKPVFVTDFINIDTLKAGIFSSEASLFSPVEIRLEGEAYASSPHEGFQTLSDCCEGGANETQLKKALSAWASYAGVAGVGQYSIIKKKPAMALARFDILFRQPSSEEMKWDFEHFGEQVMGEEIKKGDKRLETEAILTFGGDGENRNVNPSRYLYRGMPRFSAFIFNTIVKEGEIPNSIGSLVKEIEKSSAKAKNLVAQAYHFYYASDGKLSYFAFRDGKEYSKDKLMPHGELKIVDKKLIYFPKGLDGPQTDFTQELVNH